MGGHKCTVTTDVEQRTVTDYSINVMPHISED